MEVVFRFRHDGNMPERSSKRKKKETDFTVTAFRVVREATGQSEEPKHAKEPEPPTEGKNPHAVALGRMGGKVGGNARAAKLTPEQRAEIVKKAAAKRWAR